MDDSGQGLSVRTLVTALALHILIFWAAKSLPHSKVFDAQSSAQQGSQSMGPTRVTFVDPVAPGTRELGDPEPQPYPNRPAESPIITGPSTSAPRAPEKVLPRPPDRQTAPPPLVAESNTGSQERALVPLTDPKRPTETQQATPTAEVGPGFNKNLRNLLPNSESEFVATQRRIGTVYGQGAVGGDLDPESDAPVGYRAPQKGEVSITRYDYAAYFSALDRRFSEAWGGTRFLPRGSTFVGSAGEVIEYDIVIHRNGSLSKIINVSKQKQKNRDFSAVDQLVHEVFSHVFPLSPIPNRIPQDPLILRKRIQFTGYQYFMF